MGTDKQKEMAVARVPEVILSMQVSFFVVNTAALCEILNDFIEANSSINLSKSQLRTARSVLNPKMFTTSSVFSSIVLWLRRCLELSGVLDSFSSLSQSRNFSMETIRNKIDFDFRFN